MICKPILDHVLEFLRKETRIEDYLSLKQGPYFLALQGVQGSGKTTLAKELAETLRSPPWSLATIVISVDDFYLTHEDQAELARHHPTNPLIQHRGQPSTHDVKLWKQTFDDLKAGKLSAVPQYDKSCFNGEGDRVDISQWELVNETRSVQVVIFEGWNVGFRALSEQEVRLKWENARRFRHEQSSRYSVQLAYHKLEDLLFINSALREEEQFWNYFQDLVQIDARLPNVYKWRLQQEAALRATKGNGMTDEQVKKFIDAYYPSYELYTEALQNAEWRKFAHPDWTEQHLRICIDDDRQVKECFILSNNTESTDPLDPASSGAGTS